MAQNLIIMMMVMVMMLTLNNLHCQLVTIMMRKVATHHCVAQIYVSDHHGAEFDNDDDVQNLHCRLVTIIMMRRVATHHCAAQIYVSGLHGVGFDDDADYQMLPSTPSPIGC